MPLQTYDLRKGKVTLSYSIVDLIMIQLANYSYVAIAVVHVHVV